MPGCRQTAGSPLWKGDRGWVYTRQSGCVVKTDQVLRLLAASISACTSIERGGHRRGVIDGISDQGYIATLPRVRNAGVYRNGESKGSRYNNQHDHDTSLQVARGEKERHDMTRLVWSVTAFDTKN